MQKNTFNIHQAKTHFSKLLSLVEKGEEVVIAKAGKPIAKLSAIVPLGFKGRKLGAWEGKVEISSDFDEESEEINQLFYSSQK